MEPPFQKNKNDIKIIEKSTVFNGYFKVDRYILQHRLYDGGWSTPMSREIFVRGHAVGVLLYDPEADEVGLIEQFRPGALAAGFDTCWIPEIVAGIIEEGENLEDVARRETLEEAGVKISALKLIQRILPDSGGSSHTSTLYCARVRAKELGGVHGLEGEHEDIRVFSLPTDEAIEWLNEARFSSVAAIIALQWLALNKKQLREEWLEKTEKTTALP